MSRLIDADKLIQELEKNKTLYIDEYEEGRNTGISWCIEDVVDAPTVKAIPIEWINNYARKICADDGGRYNSKAYGIDRMIYDWEKENDKDSE